MSTLGGSIKYTLIAVAAGYFFYQFSPPADQANSSRDFSERQRVLDVMRKASGLELPNTASTNSERK